MIDRVAGNKSLPANIRHDTAGALPLLVRAARRQGILRQGGLQLAAAPPLYSLGSHERRTSGLR
jgi:hypothetical protein